MVGDYPTWVRVASGIGLIGGSIEDATGNPDEPIFDLALAIERIRAAADAAADLPFLLTPARKTTFGADRTSRIRSHGCKRSQMLVQTCFMLPACRT
ncbi:protein of unknown function [Nitratireductor aquimarinus]